MSRDKEQTIHTLFFIFIIQWNKWPHKYYWMHYRPILLQRYHVQIPEQKPLINIVLPHPNNDL